MNHDTKKAQDLLNNFIYSNEISTTRRAIIAYELGFYDIAFNLLHEQGANQLDSIQAVLLLADLELLRGNQLIALDLYRTALAMDPQFSPIPWLNVALLSQKLLNTSQADTFSMLNEGFNRFPTHTLLVIARLQYMQNQVEAQQQIRAFNQTYPNNSYSYLFWLNHFNPIEHLEVISAKLWNLFNYNPSDAYLTRYMIWFFLGQRNFDDARLVLQRYRGVDESWKKLRSAHFALERNFSDASALLKEEDAN